MAVTLHNGDRFRVTGHDFGGVRMERARKKKTGWARAAVTVEASTLFTDGWTPLGVIRFYRSMLSSALYFGEPGKVLEITKPSVVPLGVKLSVYHLSKAPPKEEGRARRPPVPTSASLLAS